MARNKIMLTILIALLCAGSAFAAATRESAQYAIGTAESRMSAMQSAGFQTGRVNDTIGEAKRLLAQSDYTGAETIANYVKTIAEAAAESNNLTDEAEGRIYGAEAKGIDISAAKDLLNAGIVDFDKERYEDARSNFEQAIAAVDAAEAAEALKKSVQASENDSVLGQLRANVQIIVLAGLVILIIALVIYSASGSMKKRIKLSSLEKGKADTESAIIALQNEYFKRNSITEEEYKTSMKKYKEDMNRINRNLTALKIKDVVKNDKAGKSHPER
jgi:hypothetical protein